MTPEHRAKITKFTPEFDWHKELYRVLVNTPVKLGINLPRRFYK